VKDWKGKAERVKGFCFFSSKVEGGSLFSAPSGLVGERKEKITGNSLTLFSPLQGGREEN